MCLCRACGCFKVLQGAAGCESVEQYQPASSEIREQILATKSFQQHIDNVKHAAWQDHLVRSVGQLLLFSSATA